MGLPHQTENPQYIAYITTKHAIYCSDFP